MSFCVSVAVFVSVCVCVCGSVCVRVRPCVRPQELRGRILVKGKRETPHLGQLGKESSFSSSSEDETLAGGKRDPTKVNPRKATGSGSGGQGLRWRVERFGYFNSDADAALLEE